MSYHEIIVPLGELDMMYLKMLWTCADREGQSGGIPWDDRAAAVVASAVIRAMAVRAGVAHEPADGE